MNRLLPFLLLLGCLSVRGANPAFTDFNPNDFVILNVQPKISINPSFTNTVTGSNANFTFITNVIIYSSNTFTTNLTVFNTTVTSNLFTTNITVFDTLITSNAYITNLFVTNLVAGVITNNTFISSNAFITNIFTTNLFATTITNVTLVSSNIFTTNLNVFNTTVTSNLFSTNIITTNIFVLSNAYAPHIFAIDASFTNNAAGQILVFNAASNIVWDIEGDTSAGSITYSNGSKWDSTGFSGNGSGLTNLTLKYSTNAIPALTLTFGKAYYTNLAANVTLTAFVVPDSAALESLLMFVTNNSGADRTVTGPSGVWGLPGSGSPPVYYCTNNRVTILEAYHYGQALTNFWKLDFAP